jgi:membrane protein DedA with SNARE-associated domain
MKLGSFILFTAMGAGIWNIILAAIGYFAYDMRDKIFPYLDKVMYTVGAIFIIWLAYKGWKSYRNKKNRTIQ